MFPKPVLFACVAAVAGSAASAAHAQARPTATAGLTLSVFGGATGTLTGFDFGTPEGRNLGITAGVDLGIRPFYGLYPTAEVRGTYAVNKGQVAGESNLMGGLKVAHPFGRYHVYANFLIGRGVIDYPGGRLDPTGTLFYQRSIGSVYSPGVGVDIDLSPRFALKLDGQYQRYESPVVTSGRVQARAVTVGLVYRFDFNHGGYPRR